MDHVKSDDYLIKTVLISVFVKKNLVTLLQVLHKLGVSIISSGRSAEEITRLGYTITDITEYTNIPEAPDNLVKTLHHKLYCGILLDPSNKKHRKYMEFHKITKIDMIIMNFYPCQTIENQDHKSIQDFVKHIDIGGPAMVRAAAKAALLYSSVTIVTDIHQYPIIIKELKVNDGEICNKTKRQLALQALYKAKSYDEMLISILSSISY
jgi:phosphoribosylaminoimidazolecarboxamide formyltransferase/IMP cyclohydrolase